MKRIKKLIITLVCICMTLSLVNVPTHACEKQDSVYGRLPMAPMNSQWKLITSTNYKSYTKTDTPENIQGEFEIASSTQISIGGSLYKLVDLGLTGSFSVGAKITLKLQRARYDKWEEYDEYYSAYVSGTTYRVASATRHCKVWKGHSYGPWRLGAL